MNGQIVLCKGWNDKKELEKTIKDLYAYLPVMESVSVVPVGLSKYRDGLTELLPFTKEEAEEVIDLIEVWQEKCYQEHGLHFIHASDEWYILAGRPFPEEIRYDGYLQLENGVGMMRLLWEEAEEAIEEFRQKGSQKSSIHNKKVISIATGKLAFDMIEGICQQMMEEFPWLFIRVYAIENEFFGEHVTVSGLITGQDLINQLKDRELGECLLLPENMLKANEEIFLDDVSLTELQNALQVKVDIVKSEGKDLINKILRERQEGKHE